MTLSRYENYAVLQRGPGGTRIAEVLDGLSNSMMISEDAGRPLNFNRPKKNAPNPNNSNAMNTKDGWGLARSECRLLD